MDRQKDALKRVKEGGMTLLNSIAGSVPVEALAKKVKDIRMGLGYTAVMVEKDQAGLAYTIRDDGVGCSAFCGLRPIAGRAAGELLPLLGSNHPLEVALGLAMVNAITNHEKEGMNREDILDHLNIRPSDRIGMVGLFAPLIAPLRERGASLQVFERDPRRQDEDVLPSRCMEEKLPLCQVVLITSTALINGTIDDVLCMVRGCREVALLGPSTPLVPEAFTDTPVTCLSGVIVTRPYDILRIVSEGGGMRDFRGAIEKVCIRI